MLVKFCALGHSWNCSSCNAKILSSFLPVLCSKMCFDSLITFLCHYFNVFLSLSCMLSIRWINTISMHLLSDVLNLLSQLLPKLLILNFLSVAFFPYFQLSALWKMIPHLTWVKNSSYVWLPQGDDGLAQLVPWKNTLRMLFWENKNSRT